VSTQAIVIEAANRYGVPADLAVRLARQESGVRQFRADGSLVVSSAGAMGVMQLMPGTAAELGVDPRDERQNIDGGVRYLKQMFTIFGDWKTAVAAYNAGPGRIKKVLAGQQALPQETANYVLAIMGEPFTSTSPPTFSRGQAPPNPPRPGQPIPRAPQRKPKATCT